MHMHNLRAALLGSRGFGVELWGGAVNDGSQTRCIGDLRIWNWEITVLDAGSNFPRYVPCPLSLHSLAFLSLALLRACFSFLVLLCSALEK